MAKTRITQAEQAVLMWPMLALAARQRLTLSYEEVEGFTGIARYGQNKALFLIHQYCKRHKFPILNSIVGDKRSRLPGPGFPEKMNAFDQKDEQLRVFGFNWAKQMKPRCGDFSRGGK